MSGGGDRGGSGERGGGDSGGRDESGGSVGSGGGVDRDAREGSVGGALAALSALIGRALEEDVGDGDRTTLWTVPAEAMGEATIVAKQPLVVAGLDAMTRVFRSVDPAVRVECLVHEGDRLVPEQPAARVAGPARALLTAERTALNFLGRLSGVATLTRRFVDAVEGTGARIVDTRKTTPGWRLLEKEAVRAGGGENHRIGLYDMVLIKDNHIAAAGGIAPALERVRRGAAEQAAAAGSARAAGGAPLAGHLPVAGSAPVAGSSTAPTQPLLVEVEVTSLAELEEALAGAPDRILLDNMPVETLREAVRRVRSARGAGGERPPELEASGNMTLERVRQIAETGVDLISVGALTHSAPSADFSMRMAPRG